MKTAISLPDELFQEITDFARRQKRSRSEVLARAAREFLERRRNRELLDDINRACDAPETEEEKAVRKAGFILYSEIASREQDEW